MPAAAGGRLGWKQWLLELSAGMCCSQVKCHTPGICCFSELRLRFVIEPVVCDTDKESKGE